MPDGAHTSSDISLDEWIRAYAPTAKDEWRCSDALGVLLQRWQSLLSNRAMSACVATQRMPASRLLIRQTYMSLDCTAESDVDLRSMATIVELVYVFVNDRLGASSESVELVLVNDFER